MKRGLFDMAWWSSDSNRGPDPSDPDPEAGSEVTADPFWAEDNWGWKKKPTITNELTDPMTTSIKHENESIVSWLTANNNDYKSQFNEQIFTKSDLIIEIICG